MQWGVHLCGQVISGVVWNLRERLFVTEPENYRTILSTLVIDSILLNPPGITDGLAVDYLTLDDNDGDIENGTPHYTEISESFIAKNLAVPQLSPLKFTFPEGLPKLIKPQGGTPLIVQVDPSSQLPQSDTGSLLVSSGGGPFVSIPMTLIGENRYLGIFPAVACGHEVEYYVTALSTLGNVGASPLLAAGQNIRRSVRRQLCNHVFRQHGASCRLDRGQFARA